MLMKLAAQLNWERRFLIGFKATSKNWLWVWRHEDYPKISDERQQELAAIVFLINKLKDDADFLSSRIDNFKNLPKWKPMDPSERIRTTQERSSSLGA